jgi:hypothetical protein
MVSDGIKAARIQAQYSPLINSIWPTRALRANIRFAVKHVAARLDPNVRRPAGRHAAPGRPLLGRRAPR